MEQIEGAEELDLGLQQCEQQPHGDGADHSGGARFGEQRAMRRRALVWAFTALSLLLATPAFAADTVYYYSSDTLHSEVVITDQNRNVVERTTHYAPYGQVLNRDLRDGPGYGGHEEDPETNLVYMQQRYYDPEAGRFLSTDPVQADGSGGSFNRYEYANDNPYRYTDPDGRCTGSHISNSDGTCASSGDFTTQASNAHLVGASAAQRGAILGIREPSQSRSSVSVGQPQPVQQQQTTSQAGQTANQLAQVDPIVDPEEFLRFLLPKVGEIPKPDFDYPTDPAKPPAPGFEWRGNGAPGSGRGNWYNPHTGESLHPDLGHPKPIGPHYDWKAPNGEWYRYYPDGTVQPKFDPNLASL